MSWFKQNLSVQAATACVATICTSVCCKTSASSSPLPTSRWLQRKQQIHGAYQFAP